MAKKLALLLLLFLIVGVSGKIIITKEKEGKEKNNMLPTVTTAPSPTPTNLLIDQNKTYKAVLKTSVGDITVELDTKLTPITANNFIVLAKKNFYDNTVFHRVIKGFMIQGGDPNGDGTGGPGYTFNDEKIEGDYKRGVVAMANAGPNTNGSQFFIIHHDYDLQKKYVIFGKVISGIEVVDKIAEAPVTTNTFGEVSKPISPVLIKSIEIIEE